METLTGGCQCGRIRYSVEVGDHDAAVCHCRMCQRATGGVYSAMKNVKQAAVRWDREPDYYASSPIARRGFCRECGTPLTFQYVDGENIDLTVGSFDEPFGLVPTTAFGLESKHDAWLDVAGLPGTRSEDYRPLVDKWEKAGGSPA